MRNFLGTAAVLLAIATAAPAHAGFWSDLGNKVTSMFSGSGIGSSTYTKSYYGTTAKPIVVSRFPPTVLFTNAQKLKQTQQIQSNQFDVGYWLLTGVKVPPAKVVMQSNQKTTYNGSIVDGNGGSVCHGTGCQ